MGFIECGQTQVRARAQCYAGSSLCVSETLSFSRPQGRVIVGLHAHSSAQPGPAGKVRALDYQASAWRCAAGKNAGSYLVVLMTRSPRNDCAECEYARLYDLNGRLLATELAFDEERIARADDKGRSLMRALLAEPGIRDYRPVYR
jgi:hypothetical protein